jgi:hypothetical protein
MMRKSAEEIHLPAAFAPNSQQKGNSSMKTFILLLGMAVMLGLASCASEEPATTTTTTTRETTTTVPTTTQQTTTQQTMGTYGGHH